MREEMREVGRCGRSEGERGGGGEGGGKREEE